MTMKLHRLFLAFSIFLLSLTAFVPGTVNAKESSNENLLKIYSNNKTTGTETAIQHWQNGVRKETDSEQTAGGIESVPDEYKVICRIPIAVAFSNSSDRLPSNVTYRVTASLKAIDQVPMPTSAKEVEGVMTSEVVLTDVGKASFDPIEYTVPGDYLYELNYTLETSSNRLTISGRSRYFVRVAIRNAEDGGLTGTILVYQDLDGANQNVEEGKLGDTDLILSYTRPGQTNPDPDPDPNTPTRPITPTNPNLPDTNTNTNTNRPSGTTNTTTTSTTNSSTPNALKPNTATETKLMTYLIGIVVSGGLMIFFLLLARRKAEEN